MEVPTLKELEANSKGTKNIVTQEDKTDSPKIIQCKSKKSTPDGGGYGTGRRKNAIARVIIYIHTKFSIS